MAEERRSNVVRPPMLDDRPNLSTPEAQSFINKGKVETESPTVDSVKEEGNAIQAEGQSQASYPWDGLSAKYLRQYGVRLPEREYEILKYLGDTTYGESMQSIALEGIRKELKRRLAERGIKGQIDLPKKSSSS